MYCTLGETFGVFPNADEARVRVKNIRTGDRENQDNAHKLETLVGVKLYYCAAHALETSR